jgi:TolA-binding protein
LGVAPEGERKKGTPEEMVTRVKAALDKKESALAEAFYVSALDDLSPGDHFTVGRAAAKAHEFTLAVRALKVAAYAQDPTASSALVSLAQVYADGLKDRESARRLYVEAIKRFPGSDAARYAEKKLAALG